MQGWFFIILTPVISVMWSFRNHSNMLIWCSKTCAISNVENFESAIHFFRLLWWIQSSEGQHLFEMEIFCNIWNVFVVNKVPCWIKLLIYLKKSYWPQTCVWYMLCVCLIVHGCIFRRRGLCWPLSGLWSFSLATLCMCITRSVQRNFTTGTVSFMRFRRSIITDYVYQTSIWFMLSWMF